VGTSIASSVEWALAQLFAKVELLDTAPSIGQVPTGLAGLVDLTDVSFKFTPVLGWTASYEIGFYSAGGEKTGSWTLGPVERIVSTEVSYLAPTGLSYAIRDLTAKFMVELPRQASARRWLEDANIRPAELRPFLKLQPDMAQYANKVMLLPPLPFWRYIDHEAAVECVGNRLLTLNPPVEIVLAESIRFEFFPWLEPSTAPATVEDLRKLIFQPAIEQKMRALGVRYLLSIQGGTSTSIPGGGILCGGSGMAAGCFGFAYGSHESSFTATIVDLQSEEQPQDVKSKETSGVYVPAFVLPIPFLAPTEAAACERLAKDVHDVISKNRK
jgi:hypothetical protein